MLTGCYLSDEGGGASGVLCVAQWLPSFRKHGLARTAMNEPLVVSMLHAAWQGVADERRHCLTSSLIVRETFGGDIVVSRATDGRNHFFNRILGVDYDFWPDHVAEGTGESIEYPQLLETVPLVANVIRTVRAEWRTALRKRKPLRDIAHLIVQHEEDNAGSWASPDFSCVVITADSRERLNTRSFYPGQTFWLKRSRGEIVAKGHLDRWIVGERKEWTIDDLLSVIGSHPLARNRALWERLAHSHDRAFLLAFLTEAQALDIPVYPFFRSYGQRVIDLPDAASQIGWLYADGCILNLPPRREQSTFHKGFEFRWEPLLSPDVSAALTERMPPNGRFRDRIAIVTDSLRDYFNFLSSVSQSEALDEITFDERTMLAELLEDAPEDSEPAEYLVDALLQLGQSCAYGGAITPNGAELITLSQTLEQLSREHMVVLLDDLRKLKTGLEAPRRRRDWLEVPDEE